MRFLKTQHMSQRKCSARGLVTERPLDLNNHQAVAVSQEKKRVRNRSNKFLLRSCIEMQEQEHLPSPLSERRRSCFHLNSGLKASMEGQIILLTSVMVRPSCVNYFRRNPSHRGLHSRSLQIQRRCHHRRKRNCSP